MTTLDKLPTALRTLLSEHFPESSAMTAGGADCELPRLVPGARVISSELRQQIQMCRPSKAVSTLHATAVTAGLWQVFDQMEDSHQLAQSLEGTGGDRAGDYWHAIMHRREPDYGNSKYWFHQVGRHPVFASVGKEAADVLARCADPAAASWARKLSAGGWDPGAFVDLCAACADDEEAPLSLAAREIQWREMLLLLEENWRKASGS